MNEKYLTEAITITINSVTSVLFAFYFLIEHELLLAISAFILSSSLAAHALSLCEAHKKFKAIEEITKETMEETSEVQTK